MSQSPAPPSNDQLAALVNQLVGQPAPSQPAALPVTVAALPSQPAVAPAPTAQLATPAGSARGGFGGLLGRLRGARTSPNEVAPKPAGIRLRPRRRQQHNLRSEAPAWLVSLIVHSGMLLLLGLATLTPEVRKAVAEIDSKLGDPAAAEELIRPLVDPSTAAPDLMASDSPLPPGMTEAVLTSAGTLSDMPAMAMATKPSEGSLSSRKKIEVLSGVSLKPPTGELTRDISGGMGGRVAGVTNWHGKLDEALDQIAREILRHLLDHKITVVWMFDESSSMKDEQREIKEKFDRVANELKGNINDELKAQKALTHAIVGYGKELHFEIEQPTDDIDRIRKAIDRLRIDETGEEKTFEALQVVIARYANLISEERNLLIVLVTDESADDGEMVEEARQLGVRANVPLYVVGRQSLFGKRDVVLPWTDPVTKDVYWPTIRRGPETADLECLQYDGLHGRWDEQPAGFAPYELARMTKDTGGIYFILPSEEDLRGEIHRKEKAYSLETLREYVPDYRGRTEYGAQRSASVLRSTLSQIITQTREYGFRRHFPIDPAQLMPALQQELPRVVEQLKWLELIEKQLRNLQADRDTDPQRRWQAHYDLILAQITAYQIKAYEYGATIEEMIQKLQAGQLRPEVMPVPDKLNVDWEINHAQTRRVPGPKTDPKVREWLEKQEQEATRLYNLVIEKHPNTPWADLARTELDRGFGCQINEWRRSPEYEKRAASVPHF